jgi:hypothetical protein
MCVGFELANVQHGWRGGGETVSYLGKCEAFMSHFADFANGFWIKFASLFLRGRLFLFCWIWHCDEMLRGETELIPASLMDLMLGRNRADVIHISHAMGAEFFLAEMNQPRVGLAHPGPKATSVFIWREDFREEISFLPAICEREWIRDLVNFGDYDGSGEEVHRESGERDFTEARLRQA